MRPYDLIVKKREGDTHGREEISFLIDEYTAGHIPDYQMSAWLMAAFLNGLNEEETFWLTDAMLHSGSVYDLSAVLRPKVDKHSTGGVGDKISLILAPAVAACGVAVPMTSGRGLGYTGGTLDKLESIPGFRVSLGEDEFVSVLGQVGFVMSGQTERLAPADRKLYALRDVTGTVESIPLITSSILSKKLAEGTESVVMDVKCGSGAFMRSIGRARELARCLVGVADRLHHPVVCVLTNMDQPLGTAIGNALEVVESIAALKGDGAPDILELVSVLGAHMLLTAGISRSLAEGRSLIDQAIAEGKAWDLFVESVRLQGGDVESVENPEKLPAASHAEPIVADAEGYVSSVDAESLGRSSLLLGAGRFRKEDAIDPAAGIVIHKKIGDEVSRGQKLATLFFNDGARLEDARRIAATGFRIEKKLPQPYRLVFETIVPES